MFIHCSSILCFIIIQKFTSYNFKQSSTQYYLMHSKPHSIPFITIDPLTETKFIINQQALNLLKSSSQQISTLSICGQYRTGKSFLLNTLFFSNQGFKVSPTTQPCTKGINLWSRPVSISGKNIWILDTQGFGATNRDHSYDIKIFLITTLLSTILLYNSFGAIDENTIDKFAAICHQAKNIDEALEDLKLFWILRDFSLTIQNKDGKIMTSDEYLEQSLNEVNKQQRRAIKKVFSERHCIPLVRPVINQNVLQKLSQIDFSELRGQFVQEIYKLRKKILAQAKQKRIKSLQLTGQNIGVILQEYVELLNKGEVQTNFGLTWQNIINSQKERQFDQIQRQIQKYFNQIYKMVPLKFEDIRSIQEKIQQKKQELLSKFKAKFVDSNILTQGKNKLDKIINKKIIGLLQLNSEQITRNEKVFLELQLQNNSFKSLSDISIQNFQQYSQKSQQIKQNFKKQFEHLDQQWDYKYYEIYSQQQKTTLNLLIQKWKVQFCQLKSHKEQGQKKKKSWQNQVKKCKQQNIKLKKQVQNVIKQKQKEVKQIKEQKDLQKNQEFNKRIKSYEDKLQLQKQQNQRNMNDLKTTILELEKQFLVLKKQQKFQKSQLQENLKFQTQKIELLTNKLQQSKVVHQKNIQQLKEQYQNKLKKYDERNQQTLNQLNHQRKKFLQLNQSKKQEQSQLLQDIAQKNQKMITLRRELASIQIQYKQQLQNVLEDQRNSLTMEFSIKIQEYEHKLKIFQQKIEQYLLRIKELQLYQHQCQTFTIQNRLQKQELEVLGQKFNELVEKLKKNKQAQIQKQILVQNIKQKYEKDINDQSECMKNLKGQLKQMQIQHQNQMKLMEMKQQAEISQAILRQKQSHKNELQEKQKQFVLFKQKQTDVLHQTIKKSYGQIQSLNHQNKNKQRIIDQIKKFLSNINQTYQQYCSQIKQIQNGDQSKLLNKSFQQSIKQSPEQQFQDKSIIKTDIIMQIEYSNQLFKIAFSQLRQLFQERQQIKNSLKQTVSELQLCQNVIKQLKQQNINLKGQIETLNKKNNKNNLSKSQITQIQQNLENVKKKNVLLEKEIEVRDQIYTKRQQSIKENTQLYKETINNLTQQNNQLNEKITQLQCDLNRFTTWEGDFKYQETNKFNQEVFSSEIGHKIQTLQKINKKLKKQLQNQKEMAMMKSPGILNNVINQTKITETQTIKKQNLILRKRIQELRERQIKLNQELSNVKSIIYQQEETKINNIREQYDNYRKKAKQQLYELQKQHQTLFQENSKLKHQIFVLKQKTNENNSIFKSNKSDFQSFKERDIKQSKTYETTIHALKNQLSQMKNACDKQTAVLQLSFAQKKKKMQQQKQLLKMQCQKGSIKYGHLLKVNSQLMKQMQNLKSKSAQSIVKQKFKNQIQSLFDD